MGVKNIGLRSLYYFCFLNVWLLELLIKFNIDIMTKIVSYQIKQKTFNFNSTLGLNLRIVFYYVKNVIPLF